ncbi:MAG: PASTA domain-containing protein [Gemmatimonadota bacterium]|jgi:cell division protein FtsI (penicillin-binding protein 3)|nr:PASTA domain-containing protein [Gemmatimonadota bacterium]
MTLLGGFFLAGGAIVGRAVQLQVVEYDTWASAAEEQHRERLELPPRRGAIYDRNGVPLAISHEMYQVSVAPNELRDRDEAARSLSKALGIPLARVTSDLRGSRRWVVLPGRYSAEQRGSVGSIRGVYFERSFERFYPQGDAGRELIGAVARDGRTLGGIEQVMDSVLRGEAGWSIMRREADGQVQAAISLPVVRPVDGASVQLTIDFDMQEIADEALRDAMRRTGASGGDLLIGDPRTGEVLAAVSRRRGNSRTLTAITEPYEPGSTLKPFLVAALLAEGRASVDDRVYAEMGTWRDGSRTIRDTAPRGWLTVREALEQSSNIAFAKLSRLLSPGQQYSYLRDFGLGTATGIEYPAESTGLLRRPASWSSLSQASLAMGYELSVTPLQMLAAFGALANGGVLMKPYLVKEVRSTGGRVVETKGPEVIRRVIPEAIADSVSGLLQGVVAEGTATRASLATFAVAGKTGTSRRVLPSGGYAAGAYTSTFAGWFPAEAPTIVIFVKLDEPRGDYYGGLTAAPVTRETLHGILAARTGTLDGRSLLITRSGMPAVAAAVARPSQGVESLSSVARGMELPGSLLPPVNEPEVIDLLNRPQAVAEVKEETVKVAVPPLAGLSVREAARLGHEAGLAVKVRGSGKIVRTEPVAGSTMERGSTLTLVAAQ